MTDKRKLRLINNVCFCFPFSRFVYAVHSITLTGCAGPKVNVKSAASTAYTCVYVFVLKYEYHRMASTHFYTRSTTPIVYRLPDQQLPPPPQKINIRNPVSPFVSCINNSSCASVPLTRQWVIAATACGVTASVLSAHNLGIPGDTPTAVASIYLFFFTPSLGRTRSHSDRLDILRANVSMSMVCDRKTIFRSNEKHRFCSFLTTTVT